MIGPFKEKYAFLSNFFKCCVVYEGVLYGSSEAAYQAAKTLDPQERIKIASLRSPGEAKKAGQILNCRPDWEEIKYNVMKDILRAKFRNTELRAMLQATGDEELVEINHWHDYIWGVCDGKGTNMLGKLLMEVRVETV